MLSLMYEYFLFVVRYLDLDYQVDNLLYKSLHHRHPYHRFQNHFLYDQNSLDGDFNYFYGLLKNLVPVDAKVLGKDFQDLE